MKSCCDMQNPVAICIALATVLLWSVPVRPFFFYFLSRVATATHTVRVHCSDWGERGRRPYASTGKLQEIAQEMLSVHGSTLGRAELTQELQQRREVRLAAEGISTISGHVPPCKSTVVNTMNLLQAMPAFHNINRPVHKIEKRLIAETSLLSAVHFRHYSSSNSLRGGGRSAPPPRPPSMSLCQPLLLLLHRPGPLARRCST